MSGRAHAGAALLWEPAKSARAIPGAPAGR